MVRTRIRESETDVPPQEPPAATGPAPIEEPYASMLAAVIQDLDVQLAEDMDRQPRTKRRWWQRHRHHDELHVRIATDLD